MRDPLPMAPLDLVSWWMDTPERPLDFTTIHHLTGGPPTAAFAAGMASARRRFRVSGRLVGADGRSWIDGGTGDAQHGFRAMEVPAGADGDRAAREAIGALVDAPFDLTAEAPVKQLLVRHGDGTMTIATRFHHAACDGAAASMWLAHQWRVAFVGVDTQEDRAAVEPPLLRRHRGGTRRSPLAPTGPTPVLSARSTGPRRHSRERRWRTLTVPVASGTASRDPLLAAAFLDALVNWDRARRGKRSHATVLGLWVPVDVRVHAGRGFGNGTSRIRVYARWNGDTPWGEKVQAVRRQIMWSLRNGEWALPSAEGLARLPVFIARPLLRAYLNRPWVDMGSAAFTYVPRHALGDATAPWASVLCGAESVGMLHRRHPVSLIVTDVAGAHACTFTYDPALLSDENIDEIARSFIDRVGATTWT